MPVREVRTKFYHFRQNNSGGRYRINETKGIAHNVIVEATSYQDANQRAEDIGLDFSMNDSCECCGSRWTEQYSEDGTEVPTMYGQEPVDWYTDPSWSWASLDHLMVVHYLNGEKVFVRNAKDAESLGSKVVSTVQPITEESPMLTTLSVPATDCITWNKAGEVRLISATSKVIPAQHPNPYFCVMMEPSEKEILGVLAITVKAGEFFYVEDDSEPGTFWLHQAVV